MSSARYTRAVAPLLTKPLIWNRPPMTAPAIPVILWWSAPVDMGSATGSRGSPSHGQCAHVSFTSRWQRGQCMGVAHAFSPPGIDRSTGATSSELVEQHIHLLEQHRVPPL